MPFWLRLCRAMKNGELKLYEGTKPALTEKAVPNPGHALAKVSWSAAQLACLGTGRELSVLSIGEDGPQKFQQLGKVAEFRVSGQGAALVARDGGTLKLIEMAAVPAPVVRDDASTEEKAAAIAKQAKAARAAGLDVQGQRELVTRPELARKGWAIGLSSMRPEFTRRPVSLNGTNGSAGAVRFVEPVAPPFPQPGAIVLGLPSSEPAAGSAAGKE